MVLVIVKASLEILGIGIGVKKVVLLRSGTLIYLVKKICRSADLQVDTRRRDGSLLYVPMQAQTTDKICKIFSTSPSEKSLQGVAQARSCK